MLIERWFILSSMVGLMIALATLINTYIINSNVSATIMIVYKFTITFIATMLFLIYSINNNDIKLEDLYNVDNNCKILMLIGGVLSSVLIFTSLKALKNVPNGGYSVAIKSSVGTIASIILSVLFLKSRGANHINLETSLGIVMILVGSYLIKVYSRK